ncbi:hypothetical protein M5K25_014504 [Dendrobium thyrsiflorum]|uniref:DUF4283 domain-containing protein n=1 Tax=Dendrobium thyrsiflorum TaxID=117978 RepID=A0ABD0UWD4_DENTH
MSVKRLKDPDFLDISLKSHSFLEAFAGNKSDACFPELKSTVFCGLPSLWISEEEILSLAAPLKFALVGFFPSRQPNLDSLRRFFFNLKLNGDFSVTQLDPSHVLIKLVKDLDYSRVFYHRSYSVSNYYMKLIKWSPFVDIGVESSVILI